MRTPLDPDNSNPILVRYLRDIRRFPLLKPAEELALARAVALGRAAEARLTGCPKLAAAESARLQAAVAAGDDARRRLIESNARLVVTLAGAYIGRGVPLLDLIQEGNLALIQAVERFDYRRGLRFSTYAAWGIRMAVVRALLGQRPGLSIPLRAARQATRLMRAATRLGDSLGRDPTPEELAAATGDQPCEVRRILEAAQKPVSLDEPALEDEDADGGDWVERLLGPGDQEPEQLAEQEKELQVLLETLPPRERCVLELRYGLPDGRVHTLADVAGRLNLSPEGVRKIQQRALTRLRLEELDKNGPVC